MGGLQTAEQTRHSAFCDRRDGFSLMERIFRLAENAAYAKLEHALRTGLTSVHYVIQGEKLYSAFSQYMYDHLIDPPQERRTADYVPLLPHVQELLHEAQRRITSGEVSQVFVVSPALHEASGEASSKSVGYWMCRSGNDVFVTSIDLSADPNIAQQQVDSIFPGPPPPPKLSADGSGLMISNRSEPLTPREMASIARATGDEQLARQYEAALYIGDNIPLDKYPQALLQKEIEAIYEALKKAGVDIRGLPDPADFESWRSTSRNSESWSSEKTWASGAYDAREMDRITEVLAAYENRVNAEILASAALEAEKNRFMRSNDFSEAPQQFQRGVHAGPHILAVHSDPLRMEQDGFYRFMKEQEIAQQRSIWAPATGELFASSIHKSSVHEERNVQEERPVREAQRLKESEKILHVKNVENLRQKAKKEIFDEWQATLPRVLSQVLPQVLDRTAQGTVRQQHGPHVGNQGRHSDMAGSKGERGAKMHTKIVGSFRRFRDGLLDVPRRLQEKLQARPKQLTHQRLLHYRKLQAKERRIDRQLARIRRKHILLQGIRPLQKRLTHVLKHIRAERLALNRFLRAKNIGRQQRRFQLLRRRSIRKEVKNTWQSTNPKMLRLRRAVIRLRITLQALLKNRKNRAEMNSTATPLPGRLLPSLARLLQKLRQEFQTRQVSVVARQQYRQLFFVFLFLREKRNISQQQVRETLQALRVLLSLLEMQAKKKKRRKGAQDEHMQAFDLSLEDYQFLQEARIEFNVLNTFQEERSTSSTDYAVHKQGIHKQNMREQTEAPRIRAALANDSRSLDIVQSMQDDAPNSRGE